MFVNLLYHWIRGVNKPRRGWLRAIARVNGARLATRNLSDLGTTGLDLVNPRDF